MSTDRIEVVGIRGTGFHGVYAHERRDGQEFVVDVALHLSTREAGTSDDLEATVNYGLVAEQVHAVLTGEPVDLVETLAERIAAACLRHERVEVVDVAVHKPQAPIEVPFGDVVVRVRRNRGQT